MYEWHILDNSIILSDNTKSKIYQDITKFIQNIIMDNIWFLPNFLRILLSKLYG